MPKMDEQEIKNAIMEKVKMLELAFDEIDQETWNNIQKAWSAMISLMFLIQSMAFTQPWEFDYLFPKRMETDMFFGTT